MDLEQPLTLLGMTSCGGSRENALENATIRHKGTLGKTGSFEDKRLNSYFKAPQNNP